MSALEKHIATCKRTPGRQIYRSEFTAETFRKWMANGTPTYCRKRAG